MPRPPKPTWVPPREGRGPGYWITRSFGEFSEKTGRRKGVRNYEIGPDSGKDAGVNRAAAQRWVDELASAHKAAERRGADPLVEDLVALFLDWAESNVEQRTVRSHQERLKTFAAFRHRDHFYGELVASQLKPGDLSRFIKAMKKGNYSPVYINSIVLSVQAMLNWAARPVEDRIPERILPANPFQGVRRPKNPSPPKRYAGPPARRAFLEAALVRCCRHHVDSMGWRFDRLFVAAVLVIQESGCRPDEACRLEWSHIVWEDAVAKLAGKSTGATGKERVIPLTDRAVRVLRAIQNLPGRHARYVFTHQARDGSGAGLAGLPWTENALAHKFKAWRDEAIAAGMPVAAKGPKALTLYAYRRDLGAEILRLTGSHAESAEVLGHSEAINARHYASFEDERAVELVRRVAEHRKIT